MNKQLRSALSFSFLALVSQAVAGQSEPVEADERAKQLEALLQTCTSCHGVSGASSSAEVPHLDGQLASYLADSMELLRQNGRPSAVPDHIPADWTPAQLKMVADHYSQARAKRQSEEFDQEKADRGRDLFSERCETCHQDSGRDTDERGAGAPVLAGQRVRYANEQIRAFIKNKRPFGYGMKKALFLGNPVVINGVRISERGAAITDANAEELAHFIASVAPMKAAKRRGRQ